MPDFVSSTSNGFEIDYGLLAKAVAAEMAGIIPAPAQVHNNIDDDGLNSFIIDRGNKTIIKNRRYSMTSE